MKNISKKKILIFVILGIIVFSIGICSGIYIKTHIEENKAIAEKEKQTSLAKYISESEITKLKEKVKSDEEGYGNNYQEFELYSYAAYRKEPDRIYFKSSKVGAFYVFEKDDENYAHLLEVVKDRMHYSVVDDYNLRCFTPVTIKKMMLSGENYIIFDYNNQDLSEFDGDYNKDIIFSFSENTRLYRLVTCLSYYKEPITLENLNRNEFADNTSLTGYQYMTLGEMD